MLDRITFDGFICVDYVYFNGCIMPSKDWVSTLYNLLSCCKRCVPYHRIRLG